MKRKLIMGLTVSLALFSFAGCGIPTLPEMTPEQEKLVTEYAAGLILKYDESFERTLLSEDELAEAEMLEQKEREKKEREKQLADEYIAKSEAAAKEKEKKDKESEKKDNKEDSGNESQNKSNEPSIIAGNSMAEFINQSDFSIDYEGYEITATYPEAGNNMFSIDASQGKELVVTRFRLSNISGSDADIAMNSSNNSFKLILGDKTSSRSCATLLLDDLSMYKDTLPAGASEEVVLLFEVNEGADLSGAMIEINNGNDKALMPIQ